MREKLCLCGEDDASKFPKKSYTVCTLCTNDQIRWQFKIAREIQALAAKYMRVAQQ